MPGYHALKAGLVRPGYDSCMFAELRRSGLVQASILQARHAAGAERRCFYAGAACAA